jgi:hypothetical protein
MVTTFDRSLNEIDVGCRCSLIFGISSLNCSVGDCGAVKTVGLALAEEVRAQVM